MSMLFSGEYTKPGASSSSSSSERKGARQCVAAGNLLYSNGWKVRFFFRFLLQTSFFYRRGRIFCKELSGYKSPCYNLLHVSYNERPRWKNSASVLASRRARLGCGCNVYLLRGRRPAISIMTTQTTLLRLLLLLLIFAVWKCQAVCVDAISDTEAVLGKTMKLTCILCMKREEINSQTKVYWYYKPEKSAVRQEIYVFDGVGQDLEGPWKGRLLWNGSKDLQDVSISIVNVTLNDSGLYECVVHRQFSFNSYTPSLEKTIEIYLVVRDDGGEDLTALYSEIMMYILLVLLTFWLLVEMIYCYRKISKSDEQVQDSATDYLAIPSENKENLPGPAVME